MTSRRSNTRRMAAWLAAVKSVARGRDGAPNGRCVFSSCRSGSYRVIQVPSGRGVATI
jgi:hypothetical protein